MDYDGFIAIEDFSSQGQQGDTIYIDGKVVYAALGWQGGNLCAPVPVKKDNLVYHNPYRITSMQSRGSFYKKRDYSNR